MVDSSLVLRARPIRLVVFDVDGTLTDGSILIGADGELAKRFSVRDGFGIRLLQKAGLHIALITGRSAPIVTRRAAELGITLVEQGVPDKVVCLRQMVSALGLTLPEVAFMGDDWPDLGAMSLCGLAAAPADADELVLERAHWIARHPGGRGAARELAEFILQAQGKMDGLLAEHLRGTA